MGYKNDICAVIISYNPDKDMIEGINSILKQQINIVIVDNGSSKEKLKFLEEISSKNGISLIKNGTNLGIAKALNIGVKNAISKGYKWVLTLDQDSILSDDMVKNMVICYENLDNKENVMILAPNHKEKEASSDNIETGCTEVLTEITSGNLVKSEAFENVGFFDEKMFIDLVDHEFCLRLNKLGYKVIRVNNALLLHSLGNTTYNNFFGKKISTSNHSALRRYYMSRNRMYIWSKYLSDFPDWIKKDKKLFISEIIRILLFENKKIDKVRMILVGIKDGKQKKYGIKGGI